MDTNPILTEYFSKSVEAELNKKIESRANWSLDEAMAYVNAIIGIPIKEYLDYIMNDLSHQPILAADVFQFSSFDDAFFTTGRVLEQAGNPGLNLLEIGKLLLNDGKARTDVALRKYGENHVKASELIGTAFRSDKKLFYLSGIGYVFTILSEEKQKALLIRLFLRNKLISQIIRVATKEPCSVEPLLYDLAEKTYLRRKSNIKKILFYLATCEKFDFVNIIENIIL